MIKIKYQLTCVTFYVNQPQRMEKQEQKKNKNEFAILARLNEYSQ